jgi:hypothetical protein
MQVDIIRFVEADIITMSGFDDAKNSQDNLGGDINWED